MLANFSVDLGGLCLRDHPPQFRRVAVLACIKNTLPFKYRLILLNANIKPVLEYCVSVGGSMEYSSISWYLKGIKRCVSALIWIILHRLQICRYFLNIDVYLSIISVLKED